MLTQIAPLHEREAREEEARAADSVRHEGWDPVEERLVLTTQVVELGEEVVEEDVPRRDILRKAHTYTGQQMKV